MCLMTPNVNFVPILTHPSHSIERREEKNCSKLLFRFYCDTKQLRKFMWEYILFGHACWYACHTHSLSRFFFSTTFLDCVMQVSVEYSSTSFLVQILFCHFFFHAICCRCCVEVLCLLHYCYSLFFHSIHFGQQRNFFLLRSRFQPHLTRFERNL